ncbi:metallophosphoesterase [uncultured Desulfobulbus sp.]|uniref:metallophosphoesterase n=1 Tax=uncultured Desulfobulbus sp. TaxID=239745 RepID=UPI0029C94E43|nr:metallophosphoesterase [uncultured Desulfobulbus sp.]
MQLISKRFIKRILLTLGILAVVGGICLIDGFYIEPYYPRVIRQTVYINGLPSEFDGLKIVQLSDLHIVKLGKREERALKKIKALNPDIICLTGDYIEDDGITPGTYTWQECAEEAYRFFGELKAKYGVYACMGNWDNMEIIPCMEKLGIHVVNENSTVITIGRKKLLIRGDSEKQPAPDIQTTIALIHDPDGVDSINESGNHVDLTLAGHWHGGQVGWPFRMSDVKYLAGLYQVGDTQLYVNRGLGMHSIAVRFNCPAEITVITLRPVK